MLDARKGPGGRDDENIRPLAARELPVNLREPQVVADAEAEPQSFDA